MTLLFLLLAVPALIDTSGTRFELEPAAQWPAAALVGAGGQLRGVLHLSEERALAYPRLDVFDAKGKRRVILRREGALPIAIFLDAREKPRLRLMPLHAQLLDEKGKELATADAETGELLSLFVGDDQIAGAEQDDAGASAQLGSESRPAARLGLDRSGWRLSVGGGRLALFDSGRELRERGPGIGPLRGLGMPARSRFKYQSESGPGQPVPSLPWEPLWLDFDQDGPTSAEAVRGPRGPALRLTHARVR